MKRKSMAIQLQGRAVSHVGPLHTTPDHPTPEPWEIPLASIVLRLTKPKLHLATYKKIGSRGLHVATSVVRK